MLPYLLTRKILSGEPIELAPAPGGQDGGLHISFIYIDDLATRLLDLAEAAISGKSLPNVVNLAGPYPVSLREFTLAIGDALGKEVNFVQSGRPRTMDLRASVTLLNSLCPKAFTNLEEGVELMANSAREYL